MLRASCFDKLLGSRASTRPTLGAETQTALMGEEDALYETYKRTLNLR
jgi:hypothetical protein